MENQDKRTKSETALREERILEFWRENKIFEKSLEQSKGRKEFIFYEGPPTANGAPGIHHLEARAFKDAIPRYKTMQGFHVRRKGGWDTHGLPVELQVEKKLGLDSKKAIEEYGIARFNQECKESVWEYLDIWNRFTRRIGFWVDQEHPYVTYENGYIESVWNIVKKVGEQELLYKDYKVVPWCPRCGTALSSHELAQGYEDVKDLSITVKFRVKGDENMYVLAWTTTPWTLPGNVALAVGRDIDYVKVSAEGGKAETFILAKERLSILSEPYEIVEEVKGAGLVGLEYEPLFPYLPNLITDAERPKLEKAYRVHEAGFVTTEDGTGVVHTAVMYGQDDFELGTQVGLPKHHMVGLDGRFLPGMDFLEGKFVKDEETAVEIIKNLAHRGLLFAKERYEHSYPHCWRCKTPLIYYARDSWYIRMSDPNIKGKLIEENKGINWEPAHIRDGRFGEWLREIKDWAISRERYWGTPLPVWQCESCNKTEVIGSIEELKSKTKKSGNKYFLMRHGEAENNVAKLLSSDRSKNHLTPRGREQVMQTAEDLKDKKITKIFSSPFLRTRETAEIIAEQIGFAKEKIICDERIRECEFGEYSEKPEKDYIDHIKKPDWKYDTRAPGGESLQDVKNRLGEFLYEIEEKYPNETILIVSHGVATQIIPSITLGADKNQSLEIFFTSKKDIASVHEHIFTPLPHNEDYKLDLHRPYIDEVPLVCTHSTSSTKASTELSRMSSSQASSGQACGGKLVRVKEVMDVWLDSGAMPFAQDHYPFSASGGNNLQGLLYPADFISEAIDQTRGWFYTLHAVGILMGRGKAFKNVICLGHLMDAAGKKMSKSLGNIVDPWQMMDKYGVDTLRLWMYSVNQPGESKNFDEKTVALLHGQVFGLLYNVLFFYELYRDPSLESNFRPRSQNVLDIWILGKLDQLVESMTLHIEQYKLLEPVRAIREFVGDLSTWYVRRSRERIKESDRSAKQTLYYVLKTLAKLLAPFAPFAAEDIWQRLRLGSDKESVHLERWPRRDVIGKIRFVLEKGKVKKVILNMETVRSIVSQGLKERQMRNLPVRQPLKKIRLKINLPKNFQRIVQEELNIKKVEKDMNLETEVEIDADITPELKEEGNYRELVRALQDMRKKIGLTPSDMVVLTVDTGAQGRELIQKFEPDLKKTVLVAEIKFAKNHGEEIKIDDLVFRAKMNK